MTEQLDKIAFTKSDRELISGIAESIRKFLFEHPELDPKTPSLDDYIESVRLAINDYVRRLRQNYPV